VTTRRDGVGAVSRRRGPVLITAFVAIGLIAPATVIARRGSPGTAAPARAATPAAHAGHVHGSTGAAAATDATARRRDGHDGADLRWSDPGDLGRAGYRPRAPW
jgi:hypothetical protein